MPFWICTACVLHGGGGGLVFVVFVQSSASRTFSGDLRLPIVIFQVALVASNEAGNGPFEKQACSRHLGTQGRCLVRGRISLGKWPFKLPAPAETRFLEPKRIRVPKHGT